MPSKRIDPSAADSITGRSTAVPAERSHAVNLSAVKQFPTIFMISVT